MESRKMSILFFALLLFGSTLSAAPIYLLFDQSCMDRLEFEQKRTGNRGTYVVYHINIRPGEKLILEVGEESPNEQNYLPNTIRGCADGGFDQSLMTRINTNQDQVFVVFSRNDKKYTISPVANAAYYAKRGSVITYTSPKYRFRFDADYGTIGENIALNNPGVKLYFEGRMNNDCSGSYLFRQLSSQSATPLTDLVLVPEIGITQERTGANATVAMENSLVVNRVNGQSYERYLRSVCGTEPGASGSVLSASRPTIPTSFNTRTTSFQPPAAGNLPPGAIVAGGNPVPTTNTARGNAPTSSSGGTSLGLPPTAITTPGAPAPSTAAPATSAATPPATTQSTHTVASGETLYGIARKYNVAVNDLKGWNNLTSNTIRRGQLLQVAPLQAAGAPAAASAALVNRGGGNSGTTLSGAPVPYQATDARIETAPAPSEMHIVQPGETLASVALTYGYTAKRFREINDLGPNDYVKVGQRLKTSDCNCPAVGATTIPNNSLSTPSTSTPSVPVPNSYGSTGGRISPNSFSARTPTTPSVPVIASPSATEVRNSGGLPDRNPNNPSANVYEAIIPSAYSSPNTGRINAPARTMTSLESKGGGVNTIGGPNNNDFGEEIVPANDTPKNYSFRPDSPYPVPATGTSQRYFNQAPTNYNPSGSNSTYTPPTTNPSPSNYEYTARTPHTPSDNYYQSSTSQRRVHVVKDGESLYGIARQYGTSVEQLRRINGLSPSDVIIAYQTLYLE